jgi:hypothetical protein
MNIKVNQKVSINTDDMILEMRQQFQNRNGQVKEIVGNRVCVELKDGDYWFDKEVVQKERLGTADFFGFAK